MGGVGLRSADDALSMAAPSISKSLSWLPKGSRAGSSRFVHVVRIERIFASGSIGRIDRSTSDRYTSVPSSFGRLEGRRRVIQ